VSYLKDSNVWHGIHIDMLKITTKKKSGAIEYDSGWYITEYFNGKQDGLGIGLDENRKVFIISNHENGWMIGYQLSFHKNGRIEKIDSIGPTKESGITPWLLDSLGNILEYGNIKNTKLLKANINDSEYRYLKRLKHNIIDSTNWYWY
jgi:antitoxin component YwqK of YwqJK toxin-antitoxin module